MKPTLTASLVTPSTGAVAAEADAIASESVNAVTRPVTTTAANKREPMCHTWFPPSRAQDHRIPVNGHDKPKCARVVSRADRNSSCGQPTADDLPAYDRGVRTIALIDHTCRHPPSPEILEAIADALTIQVERDF